MTSHTTTSLIYNSAYKVHQKLGPGLQEMAYQECLYYELKSRGLNVEKNVPMPLYYNGAQIDFGYTLDLMVNNTLAIEIKTEATLANTHMAEIQTFLTLSNCSIGILINFNVQQIEDGIKVVSKRPMAPVLP